MKRFVKTTRDIQGSVVNTFRLLVEDMEEEPVKILYDKSKSYLTYVIEVDTDITESAELYETALSKDIVEVILKGKPPLELIFEIFNLVHKNKMFVSDILVGDMVKFCKWLKKDIEPCLFSIKITEVEPLTEDVVIFLASSSINGRIEDIKFAIKGVIDV